MSYPKIKVTPPGPKAQKIVDRDHSLISPSFGRAYPLVVKSGDGCIITDVDGNEYIDMNAGLAVASVGHRHPRVTQAIKEQVDRFIHYSYTDFYYENYVDLGETLHDLLPGAAVQIRSWLVGQDQARFGDQCSGNGDSLLLAP